MMKRKLRRWACIAAGLALMIAVMAVTAPREKNDGDVAEDDAVMAVAEQDALAQFRLEQEQLRSMQIAQLDDIINSDRSSQELIDQAQMEKIALVERMEMEQLISGILRARGYTDAVAVSGEGYVTIMVRAAQSGGTDAARICELVLGQTDIKLENIKIIPIN